MRSLLALTLLAAGCAGTGPRRPLQSFLEASNLAPDVAVILVDLDDTIYDRASQEPLGGAAQALCQLARDHLIVYLTARPTYAKVPFVTQNRSDSEDFLADHAFPEGPLFTSSLWNLVAHGQRGGKVKSLEQLQAFGVQTVALGVGDRPHDLEAYLENHHVRFERAVIILTEDETRPDRDRNGLAADVLAHAIRGQGPAWPRIRSAYANGLLEAGEAHVVSQPEVSSEE